MSPDDIAVDGSGDIWVTSRTSGLVIEYSASGMKVATFADPHGPEGIAAVPRGGIVIANQNSNTLVELDPSSGRFAQLASYPNPTENPGIDGIAWDDSHGRLLVADSPVGDVFAVSDRGTTLATLGMHLGRPVDAVTVEGTTYVSSENRPGLVALTGSASRTVGTFSNIDEVVGYHGLLYVLNTATDEVDAVDPTTGASARLVTGVSSGQGLTMDAGGRLIVADSRSDRIFRIHSCG